MNTEKIKSNLWNLKYQRHLQKSHTFFNSGIALSLGSGAIILALREVDVLVLDIPSTIFLFSIFLLVPWVGFIPLIKKESRVRKDVVKWMKNLDDKDYFKVKK